MAASIPVTRPSDTLRSRLAMQPLLVDTVIAAGLTAVSLLTIAGGALDFGRMEPLSLAFVLLQTLPLVLRRRAPVLVFAITFGALVGHALFATGTFNSSIGALVALFTVADLRPRPVSLAAALVAAGSIAAVILAKAGVPAGLAGLVQSVLTVLVVWLVGLWAQERRRYIGTVEERARRAEEERERQAARAVAEERDRIARELHDVVAHHVSVIVIQAGGALRALDRRPDDARSALQAIDASGRLALADMRRMVAILGPAAEPVTASAPGTPADGPAPMPGLARLGELLENVRAAGLRTELSVAGSPRALAPGVELSAYRIVQEALTNTLKHAPDARSAVTVRYEPDVLVLEVVDDGGAGRRTGRPDLDHPGHPGHGLIGMRERAALFGGSLEAGPLDRGFRVAARLPLRAAPAAGATGAEAHP